MEPWRPLFYGALKTSILWSPEDLCSMEPGRPPLYGTLKTSTPRRLGDLHSVATKISILQQRPEDLRRPGKLHPTATCRPAPAATRTLPPPRPRRRTGDVGDLDISPLRRRGYLPCVVTCMPFILLQHGDFHPAATWTPPPPPPPYSPSSPASICGDLEIFLLRQPRPSPAAASLVTPPPSPVAT